MTVVNEFKNNVNKAKIGSSISDENNNYSCRLDIMFKEIKEEPPLKMIYSGIKQNSVGFVFGSSKAGKTIYCENLGMKIAAGADDFLGEKIWLKNGKVLFISLEEFYQGRTARNLKQANKLREELGKDWIKNFYTVPKDFPRYIDTNEQWQFLKEVIINRMPDIVFIDSLSRLYSGSIEESSIAKEVMKQLRELSNETNVTIIVIHHTPKLQNQPLGIEALAGSRILAQDADFMIGINKTFDNRRYVKEVAFRYHPENCETVKHFTIDEDCWLKYEGEEDELHLLSSFDGRRNNAMRNSIYEFIVAESKQFENKVEIESLKLRFVNSKIMTYTALNDNLNKLIADKKIARSGRGVYMIIPK